MKQSLKKFLTICLFIATCISTYAQQPDKRDELLQCAHELMTSTMNYLFDQNGDKSNTKDSQRFQWSEKYIRGESRGTGNTTIWPQGFGLATLSQMALATRGTEHYNTYATAAKNLADKFPDYITTINGIPGYSVYGGTHHRFLDDNAWAALGLLDAYELEHTPDYLTAAKMVANYMVKAGRLLENNPPGGGGMYWQDSPADDTNTYKTKNTANNGPAVVIFCRLFQLTKESTYLDYARMTYQWLYNTLLDKSSWLMWDALNVVTGEINKYQAPYTTGTMLHAASLLYAITGENNYKQQADNIAQAAYRRWFETYTSETLEQSIKLVKTEGNTHSDDIVVLMRAYEAYSHISSNRRYLTAFAQALRHIWSTRRDSETGLMNYDWKGTATQDEWTSLGHTGYVEMYARMAQLEAAGLVPDAKTMESTIIEAENTTKSEGVTTETDTRCSNGNRVGYVGNGKTLTFTFDAKEEGVYELTTYYMTYGERAIEITINGNTHYTFGCPSTDSWDGSNIGNVSVDIELKAGRNTFVIGNPTDNAPNLDKFELLYICKSEAEEPIIASAEATSPNGALKVLLECDASGIVTYSITKDKTPLITRSRLGFEGRSIFGKGLGKYNITEIHDPYDLLHGKTSHSDNHYIQLQSELLGTTENENLTIEFRIYDDGVAFRYVMPSGNLKEFSGELTEFNFAEFKQALALEYSYDYTWYYYLRSWNEMNNARGYNEPVLVQRNSDDTCILLTEAAHYGQTAGNAIMKGDKQGQLRLMAMDAKGFNPTNTISYPFETPWRTLIIGDTKSIVESTLITDLNPATQMTDTEWIRPGRVAWNWGGEDRKNTSDINVAKHYVNMAKHLGWEYVLIDDGWEGHFKLEDFVPYATENGVGVIAWYHNNKFSSSYTSCLNKMRSIARLGVKGIKIDFFDSNAQNVIKKYETILRAAAETHLMVIFHGCTRPTGWERTYPHLMSMEAVLGGEFLLDQPHMNQANHSANLVVGRNTIGSMDFTPTKLAQRTGALKTHTNTTENPYTTWSYQLALWTLFESGLQCLIDCPENILYSPIEPALRTIPTAWDETRCLEAEPNQYSTLARRNGENWYVATISSKQRTVRIKFDFLDPGKEYTAYIYRDGTACSFDISYQKRSVTSSTSLSISVKPNGGATIIISPRNDLPEMSSVSYEGENATGGTTKTNEHCSKKKYKTNISNNTTIQFSNIKADEDGKYALTLYYLMPEEERTAYIQVGTDSDKQYYNFHTRDDYDKSKDLYLAMKTIYVQLKKGTNIIIYGNDEGKAPDIDKIVVTPAPDIQTAINNTIYDPSSQSSANPKPCLRIIDGKIICEIEIDGQIIRYDLMGRKIK